MQGVQVVNDTEVRRRKKENQKLQQELRSEKEKLNSTIIKYQREINDAQAVSVALGGCLECEGFIKGPPNEKASGTSAISRK